MLHNIGVTATGIFLLNTVVFRSTLGPSCSPNGYRRVKRQKRKADHSFPCGARFLNAWSFIYISITHLHERGVKIYL